MADISLGEKIKTCRTDKGISQDRLSKLADISLNTIVKIETQLQPNPTIDTLRKIANALDVSLSALIEK